MCRCHRARHAAAMCLCGRHRPPVVIVSVCGDDKVTPGFVSTGRLRGRLPLRLKKAHVSAGTMGENYHMNMATAPPQPLKTINLPPQRQITPWISPLNLNFSGCIKRWSPRRGGGQGDGSKQRGGVFGGGRIGTPIFLCAPSAPSRNKL